MIKANTIKKLTFVGTGLTAFYGTAINTLSSNAASFLTKTIAIPGYTTKMWVIVVVTIVYATGIACSWRTKK